MRGALCVLVGWAAAGGLAVRADDPPTPRAILDRAIEAAGGPTRLAKLHSAEWETRATNFEVDPPQARTAKLYGQLPGRFRVDLTEKVGDKTVTSSRVIDNDRGWVVKDGKATAMDAAGMRRVAATFHHKQIAQTLVPLRNPAYRLETVGEIKVGDRPAVGLRVSRDGLPDLKLYFDKETGLVVRSEMTDVNPATGKDEAVELRYTGHRKFDGITLPAKTETWRDGKKIREVELIEFRANAEVDPIRFQKP